MKISVLAFTAVLISIPVAGFAVERVTTPSGTFDVEKLASATAHARLDAIKAQLPDAFQRAQSALEARGYKPTETIVIRRIQRLDKVRPAQTYTDGDTEIVFWSWDDGDDSTWEGEIYMENHTSGVSLLLDGQIAIGNPALPVTWETQIYRHGPLTSPADPGSEVSMPRRGTAVQIASLSGGLAGTDAGIQLVQFGPRHRLQHWAECSATGCWSALVACRFTGPAWPECAAGACLGVMLGCALDSLW